HHIRAYKMQHAFDFAVAYDSVITHSTRSVADISATDLLLEPSQATFVLRVLKETNAGSDLKTEDVTATSYQLEEYASVSVEKTGDIRSGRFVHSWSSLGIALSLRSVDRRRVSPI